MMDMTNTFDEIISQERLTLVDFYASWCGPCKMMHPVVDRVERWSKDASISCAST